MICSRNPKVKKFLEIAMHNLKKDNVSVKVYKNSIDNNFQIDGYFDSTDLEIGLLKNNYWLQTFVHEYAHFLQWKHHEPSFAAYYKYKYDPVILVEKWLQGKTKYDKRVKKSFEVIRKNEIECDRLAANMIVKYDLPIDVDKYRAEANHQIVFYHCVELKRSWEPSNRFYTKNLTQMLPVRINASYANRLPKNLLETALKLF